MECYILVKGDAYIGGKRNRNRNTEERKRKESRLKTAFKVSFVYIAIVALWFIISSVLELIFKDIIGVGSFPPFLLYITTIIITSKGLHQHRKLIQYVLESASILIVRLDKDLTIRRTSKNILELANFHSDELAGENISKLVDPSKILEKVEGLDREANSRLFPSKAYASRRPYRVLKGKYFCENIGFYL